MIEDDLPPGPPCPLGDCYHTDLPPPGPSNLLPTVTVSTPALVFFCIFCVVMGGFMVAVLLRAP